MANVTFSGTLNKNEWDSGLYNAYTLMAYMLKSLGYNVIEYNYDLDVMLDIYWNIFRGGKRK